MCTRPTSPGSTRRRGRPGSPAPAPPSRSTRCTASCTPPSSTSRCARCAPARSTGGPGTSAPCSTRPPAGNGRTGTRPTSRCSRSTRAGSWSGPAEWESRWWSPVINAEHLAMRDGAGLVDLSAFTILDVTGPGALAGLQHLAVAQLDVPVGRTVYTPFLNEAGRFVADLTIMRLGGQQLPRGDRRGGRRQGRQVDQRPAAGRRAACRRISAWSTIGLWGPRSRDILAGGDRDGDQSPPRRSG